MPRPNFANHKKQLEQIIRVDHAGEYGAAAIYRGQIDHINNKNDKQEISHMLEQEQEHLDYFTEQLGVHNARPTALLGLWSKLGYIAGSISAKLGIGPAMLLTEAVEEVIEDHYQDQINYLEKAKITPDMLAKIRKFQADEIEHKRTAKEYNPGNIASFIARGAINIACHGAIIISKRL